tara:strand:+ start:1860 stop:2531 length:672 start_codon:yes stop_codon:yes gene_type:complete
LNNFILEERVDYNKEIEFIEAGATLAKASDYLTSQARAFSVTGNPLYLENYWHEVNIDKRRDKAIQTLERLSSDSDLINLLTQSKRNSDVLIQTQLESMRTVLEAYQVPENLMPRPINTFKLSSTTQALSPEKKVFSAQSILYNKKYASDKQSIMVPLDTFKRLVYQNFETKIRNGQKKVTIYIILIKTFFFIALLIIVSMIWILSRLLNDNQDSIEQNNKVN